jgi:CBS domain containing-hemolysin-like protein
MEPPSSIFLDIFIIAASIIAVAVLSSSESSFIAVNKIRIRSLLEKGDPRAKAVQEILDKHDRLFSAVILSGNLFTVLATSMGTALALRFLGPEAGIVIATVVMTFVTVVFGELAPKTFAVTHSERVSLMIARPLALYIRLISPLIWIFNASSNLLLRLFGVKEKPASPFVTEDEIKTMISIGEEEGTIEEEEKKLLHKVFEFGDTEVSEAMVPRTEVVAIPEDASVQDAMALVSEKGFSRYPVIKENMDNITGILYTKDLLITMSQTDINALSISNFMHIAVVIDEYGGTAGLVTLEDIMEEIVGGLQDEFEAIEAQKDVEIIDEHTFVVSGQTPIDEINELVEIGISTEDFNTVGGYVFGLFGRLPKIGEQVRSHSLRFLVTDMEDKKISKIKITKL